MFTNAKKEKKMKPITGTGLKIIAIITMFIDHFGAILYEAFMDQYVKATELLDSNSLEYAARQDSISIMALGYFILRMIGRMGFPIFVFLLIEGFEHTRNVKKYALNLLIFGIISELPFNLGFKGTLFAPQYQNVFFTLFLGLLSLITIRYLTEKYKGKKGLSFLFYFSLLLMCVLGGEFLFLKCEVGYLLRNLFRHIFINLGFEIKNQYTFSAVLGIGIAFILFIIMLIVSRKWDDDKKNAFFSTVLPAASFALIAELLSTDYAGGGVIAIVIMYVCRKNRVKAAGLSVLFLSIYSILEVFAFFVLFPIRRYNGERGMKLNKYFFYVFYPAHIAALYLVTILLGFKTFMMF